MTNVPSLPVLLVELALDGDPFAELGNGLLLPLPGPRRTTSLPLRSRPIAASLNRVVGVMVSVRSSALTLCRLNRFRSCFFSGVDETTTPKSLGDNKAARLGSSRSTSSVGSRSMLRSGSSRSMSNEGLLPSVKGDLTESSSARKFGPSLYSRTASMALVSMVIEVNDASGEATMSKVSLNLWRIKELYLCPLPVASSP